ncbi:MAG TPA: alpha/beta hydrolase, partial [Thermodesulfobacteriota bacterium]|nr:alpha/beta hydrolase [Thermodesulfobacteriota bacterium]
MTPEERTVRVEGLRVRYLQAGRGPDVLLLHGASLGSSADVWTLVLAPLAAHGFRVTAYDQPGFGLSDDPPDFSAGYRRRFVLAFMDALGLERAHLVGHSQSGRFAVSLALERPERVSSVLVLGTGSLLPPLPGAGPATGPREGEEGTASEPTLEEVRALLEADVYCRERLTPELVAVRHRMSVGKNFRAFLARRQAGRGEEEKGVPLWQRLDQVRVPLLLLYGREDRGRAAERAMLARTRFPGLDVRILERCKHLVQIDAPEALVAEAARFFAAAGAPGTAAPAGEAGSAGA